MMFSIFSGEPTKGKTRVETILRQLTTKKGQVFFGLFQLRCKDKSPTKTSLLTWAELLCYKPLLIASFIFKILRKSYFVLSLIISMVSYCNLLSLVSQN